MTERVGAVESAGKRAYATPTLVTYGTIAKLTQNIVNGSFSDGADMMVGACL